MPAVDLLSRCPSAVATSVAPLRATARAVAAALVVPVLGSGLSLAAPDVRRVRLRRARALPAGRIRLMSPFEDRQTRNGELGSSTGKLAATLLSQRVPPIPGCGPVSYEETGPARRLVLRLADKSASRTRTWSDQIQQHLWDPSQR